MTSEPRSVRIGDDERGGWSSDRPRKSGAPEREPDVSVRGRVLKPTDLLRYSPGSLLMIVSPSPAIRSRFAERLIEQRGALFSLQKVRDLLAGKVADEEMDAKAVELLDDGFHSSLRLGGEAMSELKRLVFRPEPRDE